MVKYLDKILEKVQSLENSNQFPEEKDLIIAELKSLKAHLTQSNTSSNNTVTINIPTNKDQYFSNLEHIGKLSQAVEQSPLSIVITDLFGNIEYVNPWFTKTTGYTYEEVIGKNPRILKSGNIEQEYYKELWETISAGKEWRGEFKNITKSGETFWELGYLSAIKNNKGEITHFIALKENITELKNLTALQTVLMNMASKYINLKLCDIEANINQSLGELSQYVDVDRALIFEYDWENDVCNNTYEWCAEGIDPHIDELKNVPLKDARKMCYEEWNKEWKHEKENEIMFEKL